MEENLVVENSTEEVVVSESQETNVEGTNTELSAIEQKALEMGWRPKSDFDGDEADFIDAKEFVNRKPLFEKIEHQSKELKEIRKVLRSLQDHHVKVKETEYQRAYDALKAQKKLAYEDGDTDKVIEIDEQMVEVREAQKVAKQAETVQAQANEVHPDFANWVGNNQWYARDKSLRGFADSLGVTYAGDNPHLSPVEVLKYVTAQTKKAFPEKFTNPNKDKPAAVDGGTSSTRVVSNSNTFKLSEDEERVMKQFVRAGILTKEQYISDLKSMRGM